MWTPQTISPSDFCNRLQAGEPMTVIDVRTKAEHRTCRLKAPHTFIPLDQLDVDAWVAKHGAAPEKAVYILCAHGRRAIGAAEFLATRGVNAVVVEGGLSACLDEGIPTTCSKSIPIERQIRMLAGAFVVLGIGLGAFVSPVFYLLAGIVGVALAASGITGFCAVSKMLCHAPWNVDCTPTAMQSAITESMRKFQEKTQGA